MARPDFSSLLEPFPVISASFQMWCKLLWSHSVRRMVRFMGENSDPERELRESEFLLEIKN